MRLRLRFCFCFCSFLSSWSFISISQCYMYIFLLYATIDCIPTSNFWNEIRMANLGLLSNDSCSELTSNMYFCIYGWFKFFFVQLINDEVKKNSACVIEWRLANLFSNSTRGVGWRVKKENADKNEKQTSGSYKSWKQFFQFLSLVKFLNVPFWLWFLMDSKWVSRFIISDFVCLFVLIRFYFFFPLYSCFLFGGERVRVFYFFHFFFFPFFFNIVFN